MADLFQEPRRGCIHDVLACSRDFGPFLNLCCFDLFLKFVGLNDPFCNHPFSPFLDFRDLLLDLLFAIVKLLGLALDEVLSLEESGFKFVPKETVYDPMLKFSKSFCTTWGVEKAIGVEKTAARQSHNDKCGQKEMWQALHNV